MFAPSRKISHPTLYNSRTEQHCILTMGMLQITFVINVHDLTYSLHVNPHLMDFDNCVERYALVFFSAFARFIPANENTNPRSLP